MTSAVAESEETETTTILCGECGALIEIKDVIDYLRSEHLMLNCPSTASLREP